MYKAPAAAISVGSLAMTGTGIVLLVVAAFTLLAAGLALCALVPRKER